MFIIMQQPVLRYAKNYPMKFGAAVGIEGMNIEVSSGARTVHGLSCPTISIAKRIMHKPEVPKDMAAY